MKKSSVFLSVTLTAFVITLLAGVIYAYNGLAFTEPFTSMQTNLQDQSTAQVVPTTMATSGPSSQSVSISPQEAATIAAKSLGRNDLYSVQLATINGLNLYKVAFVSGDIVYVSMDGQVVLSVPAPQPSPTPTIVVQPVTGGSAPHRSGGGHSGDGGGGEGGD